MANTQADGGSAIAATQFNTIVVGDTAPSAPTAGDLWVDTTSSVAPITKIRGTSAYTVLQPQSALKHVYQRQSTAQVTNVTDNQTLLSITGISIPTTSLIIVRFAVTAVNAGGRIGVRLNATIVNTTATLNHYATVGTSDNLYTIHIGRRDAGTAVGFIGASDYPIIVLGATAAIPAAAITTIDILARGTGASDGVLLRGAEVLEIL